MELQNYRHPQMTDETRRAKSEIQTEGTAQAWLRRFFLALGITTLGASASSGNLMLDTARQAIFLTRMDLLALFCVMLAATATLLLLYALLRSATRGRISAVITHSIYLLLAFFFSQLIAPRFIKVSWITPSQLYGGILAVGAILSVISCFGVAAKIRALLWRLLPFSGLIFPILFIQLLMTPPFVAAHDLNSDRPVMTTATGPNVVIFLFDSISMQQCVDKEGSWRADLPALAAFRSDAISFDTAVSCGWKTPMSIPNFLFQRDPLIYDHTSWRDRWFRVSPMPFTNGVLYNAKENGYATATVGFYLPYKLMFEELLDRGFDQPFSRIIAPKSFRHRLANQALSMVAFMRGPFDNKLFNGIPSFRFTPNWFFYSSFWRMNLESKKETEKYIARMPRRGSFFFSHIAIPHAPAVFMADGAFDFEHATLDTQLQFVDKVFGDYVAAMKASKIYDSSWIIMTSDHGHHQLELTPEALRNVPFIVKAPNSQFAQINNDKLELWHISEFFKAIFQGKSAKEALETLPVTLNL